MADKKASKKQESQLQLLQRQQQAQKRQAQMAKKQARLKQLSKKSSPLVQYGLLEGYQFFLSQLASAGLPQGNIYEFAAQTMIKFGKGRLKKVETLKEVQRVNLQASKFISQSNSKQKPKFNRQIKPQLLPFKGGLSSEQMELMGHK